MCSGDLLQEVWFPEQVLDHPKGCQHNLRLVVVPPQPDSIFRRSPDYSKAGSHWGRPALSNAYVFRIQTEILRTSNQCILCPPFNCVSVYLERDFVFFYFSMDSGSMS